MLVDGHSQKQSPFMAPLLCPVESNCLCDTGYGRHGRNKPQTCFTCSSRIVLVAAPSVLRSKARSPILDPEFPLSPNLTCEQVPPLQLQRRSYLHTSHHLCHPYLTWWPPKPLCSHACPSTACSQPCSQSHSCQHARPWPTL